MTSPASGGGPRPPLRVVAVDDHPIVRAGISAVLAVEPDLELLAVVSTAAEVLAAAAELTPDVVIMDLQLPDLDGATATGRLLDRQPDLAVLVLSMHDDAESLFEAIRAGARGYLVKGAADTDIPAAVRAVAHGGALFDTRAARLLLDGVAGRSTAPLPELTDRERDILGLLAAGHGTHEVARRLYLSPKTVRNHVSHILTKLHVPDRAQAIAMAHSHGLTGS